MGRPSANTAGGDLVGRVPGGAAPPRVTEGLVCADWPPPARRRGQGGGGLPMRKQGAGGAWLNRCGCGCVWRRIPGRGPRCRSRAVRPRVRFSGQLVPSGFVGPSRLSARRRGTAHHVRCREAVARAPTIRIRLRFLWATKNHRDLVCVSGWARRTRRPPPRLSARPGWVRAIDLAQSGGERKFLPFFFFTQFKYAYIPG